MARPDHVPPPEVDSNTSSPTNAARAAADPASPGMELAREMRRRWRRGERAAAEEFLQRYPELRQRPEAAIDVIYEEYCLRQAAGEQGVEQDILSRFPQWREPLRVMLDCHRVLQPTAAVDFPSIGDTVGGFRLVAELGRGSRGSVCLATQNDLAGRSVVLKITPLDGVEHLSLARMQHTNIVPVYSVADDAARNIRILCMPYFGRATLASLLQSLAGVPLGARMGRHIVAAIEGMHEPPPLGTAASPDTDPRREPRADAVAARPDSPTAPALQMLAHVSYVQAACWIAACLADALQYAHERGLVHLDVKPSNVLLANDGQPMLLDFHLAREPIRPDGPLPDKFGGTLAYMPPEQRAVMQALQSGQPVEQSVDARADVFALGAILHELLSGTPPPASDARSLCKINPHVSVGLADIVAKGLAARPDDRYGSAAALADDLRRHLAAQPLAVAPNRSLAERWHKWRRRKPNTLRAAGMLAVVAAAASLTLAGAWSHARQRTREAEEALREGQTQLDSGQAADAVATFERGLSLIENVPLRRELVGQLRDQLAAARRLRVAGQLHELADQIRVLYGTGPLPSARLHRLAQLCREFWEKREQIAASLDTSRGTGVATDLLDVAIFWADLQIQLAPEAVAGAAREQTLRTLDEAETMFGPSRVLEYQRHVYRAESHTGASHTVGSAANRSRARSGEDADVREPAVVLQLGAGANAAPSAGRMAWEHYALGRALLNSNHVSEAIVELDKARTIDPSGAWPNFYYGLCAYRLGRHEEAVAAFSVCIGASPTLAGCFFNRALAYAALGRADRSLHDYDRSLELDSTLAAAWLNRGMLHYQLHDYSAAAADLSQALHHAAPAATVHYDLALVHLAANDTAAALADVDHALEREPSHVEAQQLRATLLRMGVASQREQ